MSTGTAGRIFEPAASPSRACPSAPPSRGRKMGSSQRRLAAALLGLCFSWIDPVAAHAQDTTQDTSVRDVLSFLMTNRAVPTGDFARDQEAANATRETIARALLVELATLPITTSSGGFSFRFNPALGTVER